MKESTKTNLAAVSEVRAADRIPQGANERKKRRSKISGPVAPGIAGPREAVPQHPLSSANRTVNELVSSIGDIRPIAESDASHLVTEAAGWNHEHLALELDKASRVGAAELSNEALLSFCTGAYSHFKRHYWIKARPFFIELWRRLEEGLVPGISTKAEACERIGCSMRWAQMIVSGYADKRNQKKPVTPTECAGSSLLTQSLAADEKPVEYEGSSRVDRILTVEEYVLDIQRFAYRKLRKVRERQWDRYRNVCRILAEDFRHASEIERAADFKAA